VSSQTRPPSPDFVLVGAPKSATGTLSARLASHPGVHIPGKDLHFFAPDLPSTQLRLSPAQYDAQYEDVPEEKLRGEASVGYLYSTTAARAIHERRSDARIVMSLRDPVTAIPSLHRHCLYYGIEEIDDLAEALAAEPDRAQGRRLPARCAQPWMLRYTDIYRYADQVRRYFDLFGRGRCHVVIYEEFAEDPEPQADALTDFLGLDRVDSHRDERVNATRQARSRRVSALITDPPASARGILRATTPQWVRRRVADSLLGLNTRGSGPAEVVDVQVRTEIARLFAQENAHLSELLGRDLPWGSQPRDTGRSAAEAG
jgi:hypothetical protein